MIDDTNRRPLMAVASVAAVLATVTGILVAGARVPNGWDRPIQTVVDAAWPAPGAVAYAIDGLGDPLPVAILVVLLAVACFAVRRRRTAWVALLAVPGTPAVTTGVKLLVDRTIHGDNLSYPSGHVAIATATAAVALLVLMDVLPRSPRVRVCVLVLVPLVFGVGMAIDQVAIQAHYPTDAIGGACVALAVVPAVALAVDRVGDVLAA